jgi:membrane-bound lytic murein transglycosylase D
MKKHFYFLCCFLLITFFVHANNPLKDTIPSLEYSNFDKNLDSLMSSWYVQESVGSDSTYVTELDSATLLSDHPDSFYTERIKKIPSVIELTYNDIVKRCIQIYTQRHRDRLEIMLGLKDYYFPIMEEILDSYGLPIELKYLSVVESALNPRAVSRCGATGLWQFMYGTGRMYKLTINSFVDERRDLIAATHAAAKYFMDMYKIYKDWNLVIASYNCGPGNVNKAIRRSGGKTNYWEIYNYLPRETRSYVPLYIAATYAMNYYKDHNLTPRYIDVPPYSDTVMVAQNVHLQQVSSVLNLPLQQLRDLNPQYRRDILPGAYSVCPLRLPAQYATKYIDNESTILSYRRDELFTGEFKTITPTSFHSKKYSYTPELPSGNKQKLYHTILSGESIGGIAEKYRVRVSDLRYWNNVSGNRIIAGQKLLVYVPRSKAKNLAQNTKAQNKQKNTNSTGDFIYYQVKDGDTLWKIASQFAGITDRDLREWNNLGTSNITPGQTIKIKKM